MRHLGVLLPDEWQFWSAAEVREAIEDHGGDPAFNDPGLMGMAVHERNGRIGTLFMMHVTGGDSQPGEAAEEIEPGINRTVTAAHMTSGGAMVLADYDVAVGEQRAQLRFCFRVAPETIPRFGLFDEIARSTYLVESSGT